MKTTTQIILVLFIVGFSAMALAQDYPQQADLKIRLDSLEKIEANVFAPESYANAMKKHKEALRAIELQKKSKSVEHLLQESIEHAENAINATEVAMLSLSENIEPRQKALDANARILVPEIYEKAELQFIKATKKVENGDVKGGLKEAVKAKPLFDIAELEAYRVEILGLADSLVSRAIVDDAKKYALSTFNKAVNARVRGDSILTKDRYNRTESVESASLAEYEAQHSSNIAQSVRALERNDQAWEKLMLVYEIQMQQVADKVGVDLLRFDNGPSIAADTLANRIQSLQDELKNRDETLGKVVEQLQSLMTAMGASSDNTNAVMLAQDANNALADVLAEKSNLAQEIASSEEKLKELEQAHEVTASELDARKAQEEKFQTAKSIINPSQGTVLYNATNDVVLRLSGLSFDVGSSDIKDNHISLLTKVTEVIGLFPDSRLMVEGHTDDTGESGTNMRLSEKRSFAVMQYLRQATGIPADRITSMGFGPDRPVASNKTSEGRAKNRRIDIIIMQ